MIIVMALDWKEKDQLLSGLTNNNMRKSLASKQDN